jgi:hypothetical protein
MTRLILVGATLLALLAGDAWGQNSWDEYVSKTQTLKLFTFVPCDATPDRVPEHQTYYHAWYFAPTYGKAFWIGSADATGKYNYGQRIFITVLWYFGISDYTNIQPAYPDVRERNPKCAALLVLPTSDHGKRVFYAATEPATALKSADRAYYLALSAGIAALLLLLIARMYIGAGLSAEESERGHAYTLALLGIVFVAAIIFLVCSMPIENVKRLVEYYIFYDHLPRGSLNDLLPLSWAQVLKLINGPPLPSDTAVDYRLYYQTVGVVAGVWLVVAAPAIAFGIYCVHFADPFRELRKQAKRRGEAPSPEEYMAVLSEAALSKSRWRLDAIRRRAQSRRGW